MARAAIVREISGVFGVYSIEVDIRHLELIADYMVGIKIINSNVHLNSVNTRHSKGVISHSIGRVLACTHLRY
jgi:hypothetical protein